MTALAALLAGRSADAPAGQRPDAPARPASALPDDDDDDDACLAGALDPIHSVREDAFATGPSWDGVARCGEQVRLLSANPIYLAGRPPVVGFGLAERHEPVEVRVRWPDGVETVHPDVPQGFVRITRP